MEVLDGGRPPGVLERLAASLLRRRGAKAGVAVALVLLLTGGWIAFSPSHEGSSVGATAEAEEASAATGSSGLRPAPALGRQGASAATWKVAPHVDVRSGPQGHNVLFFAINRGSGPQDPRKLRVAADFVGRPGLTYEASCVGVEHTRQGYEPVAGAVAPGERVLVRCQDMTAYRGRPARIDRRTVVVKTSMCHEGEGSPGL